jgi:hypothetical protein
MTINSCYNRRKLWTLEFMSVRQASKRFDFQHNVPVGSTAEWGLLYGGNPELIRDSNISVWAWEGRMTSRK